MDEMNEGRLGRGVPSSTIWAGEDRRLGALGAGRGTR